MTLSILVKDSVFPICMIQLILYRSSTIYILYWIVYNLTILVLNCHVTLQVGRTVRRGHVGFYQGNNKGPRILDNCRGQGPTMRQGVTLGQAHTRAWSL